MLLFLLVVSVQQFFTMFRRPANLMMVSEMRLVPYRRVVCVSVVVSPVLTWVLRATVSVRSLTCLDPRRMPLSPRRNPMPVRCLWNALSEIPRLLLQKNPVLLRCG